jgi:hypothetical protein
MDDIVAYFYIGLVYLLVIILALTPTFISFLLYRYLKKRGHKIIGVLILSVTIIATAYVTYTQFYPTDRFFNRTFESYLGYNIPDSGELIQKEYSDDITGDFDKSATYKFSEDDYLNILKNMQSDTLFEKYDILTDSMNRKYNKDYLYSFKSLHSDKGGGDFDIYFGIDSMTIKYSLYVW